MDPAIACVAGTDLCSSPQVPNCVLLRFTDPAGWDPKIFSERFFFFLTGLIDSHFLHHRRQWLLPLCGSTIFSLPRSDSDHHHYHFLPMELPFEQFLLLQLSFRLHFCSLLLYCLLELLLTQSSLRRLRLLPLPLLLQLLQSLKESR